MRRAAPLAILVLCGCVERSDRPPVPSSQAPAQLPPPGRPRILHLYAHPSVVRKGQSTRICYGVENAARAQIDPRPGDVPAFANRCFEIGPDRTTEYVLTAFGAGGGKVSQRLKVAVSTPEPKPPPKPAGPEGPPRPRILSFTVNPQTVSREAAVTLCYETSDAASVRIEPPVVDFRLPARGCFGHAPETSTAYRLTATGPGGSDTREVAVTVR